MVMVVMVFVFFFVIFIIVIVMMAGTVRIVTFVVIIVVVVVMVVFAFCRTAEQVIERYQRVLKPMHEQFIEPCKRFADVIVPQGGHNNAAINMLAKFVKQQLKEQD